MERKKTQDLEYLVKVYEAMPPEEAGARLSALEETMAALILKEMKPRKAGAIMATMEPGKVAAITRHLSPRDKKKIPIE
jgi:flagellar motility protein MotE (MotC chaperone)